ncbi:hypothetical protein ACFL6C_11160, partial [Myxococcota bacterium]
MTKLRACEERLATPDETPVRTVDRDSLLSLAGDLERVWNAPSTLMRTKQRLLRTLVEEIIVDVDDTTREIVMVLHWRGGQHSELRVKKPASGEHTKRACDDAARVIKEMATRWSDADTAATLNRMGFKTGQGLSWNAVRVGAYRRKHGIVGYESAVKDGR